MREKKGESMIDDTYKSGPNLKKISRSQLFMSRHFELLTNYLGERHNLLHGVQALVNPSKIVAPLRRLIINRDQNFVRT